ncbi:MAG TPA: hypothetical protein VF120_03740 [Ktedonobacterales bacterium]
MRTVAILVGLGGALVGMLAAGYGFVLYMVEATNGMENPLAARIGFDIAAFVLAGMAAVGAVLSSRRPLVGSALMTLGSVLGLAAISLFTINTWYILAVPLCLVSALLLVETVPWPATPSFPALAWRIFLLALLVAMAVVGYFVAGMLAAMVLGALAVLALVLGIRPQPAASA